MAESSTLVYLFVIVVFITFGVSLWIIRYQTKKITYDEPDIAESTTLGFDDIIIDQAKERISHELSISQSMETKASVLVAYVGVIGTLVISNLWNTYLEIFKKDFFLSFLFIIGATFLIISLISALFIIKPRIRLHLLNPINTNNAFVRESLNESKDQIKKNLLKNFYEIRKEVLRDTRYISGSFWTSIIGSILLVIPFIYKIIIDFIPLIQKL